MQLAVENDSPFLMTVSLLHGGVLECPRGSAFVKFVKSENHPDVI